MTLDIKYFTPLTGESPWSNMLAAFLAADQDIAVKVLGLSSSYVGRLFVKREVSYKRPKVAGKPQQSDRADIVVFDDASNVLALIESKVFADLDDEQLGRYTKAVGTKPKSILVTLAAAPVPAGNVTAPWRTTTWDAIVLPFLASSDPQVAVAAQAWISRLQTRHAAVSGTTRWNELPQWGAEQSWAILAGLRMRADYLDGHLVAPGRWWSASGRGGKSVNQIRVPIPGSDHYDIYLEIEEDRTIEALRNPDKPKPIRGASVRIHLRFTWDEEGEDPATQLSVSHYDWPFLVDLWKNHLKGLRPWLPNNHGSSKASSIVAGRAYAISKGVPKWAVGGYNMSRWGYAAYGPRFRLDEDATLDEVVQVIDDVTQEAEKIAAAITATGRLPKP